MTLFERARAVVADWIAPPEQTFEKHGVAEAIGPTGVTIDNDDHLYQRLTAQRRDLPEVTQTRMQDLGAWLWQSNLLARQLIEMPIAFLLARGVRVTVPDPEAQKRVDAWWSDPVTDVALRLPEWMRGLRIHGEQCWPVFVDQSNGHVRLGYLDPGAIATVVPDPENAACPIGIVTRSGRRGQGRRYRIIYLGPETMFSTRTREIRETFTDGDCFYWRKNVLGGGRGRSDLLAAIDWLDAYERFLFGEIDRADFLRAFVWDVSIAGAKPDEVEERAKQIKAPEPGSVRVHNDSETWSAVVPDLKSFDAGAAARNWRNHILGGLAIPEHWFGGGGDVNRATAGEMGEPAFKAIMMEQRLWTEILRRVAAFVVWRSQDPAGLDPPDPAEPDPDLTPMISWPELVERDVTKHAAALQATATAGAVAIDRGILSTETVTRLLVSVAERLGVEIDPGEEIERARKELAANAENDAFRDPPG